MTVQEQRYLICLVLFIMAVCTHAAIGDTRPSLSLDSGFSDSDEYPPVTFPLSGKEIISEVTKSLSQAETEIEILAGISDKDRNETNTLLGLDIILTRLDYRLYKYTVLERLYRENDLAEASRQAAARRTAFLHELATRSDLYWAIRNTTPESDLGREIQEQEMLFFKRGGAELPADKKMLLLQKYSELEDIRRRYLNNTQTNGLVSINLQLLRHSAGTRNDIATMLGYRNWFDLISGSGSRDWNAGRVISYLDTVALDTRGEVKPVIRSLLEIKEKSQPNASFLYDYETLSLLNQEQEHIRDDYSLQSRYPVRTTVSRCLQVFSCLFDIRIDEADAPVYAPEVSVYRISGGDPDITLGWLYLDLREGGQGNPGWMTAMLSKGGYQGYKEERIPPVFLISGTISSADQERWFTPDELRLFFHELGHFFAGIFSFSEDTSPYIPAEMTETSSLLFEHISQTPEMMQMISAPGYSSLHPVTEDLNNKTPYYSPDSHEEIWNRAIQVIISLLDLRIATSSGDIRFEEWYTEYYQNITGVTVTDNGGYLLASPRLIDDTAGSYWEYVAGDLSARVLFDHFRTNGVLNISLWKELKEKVLSPGNPSWSSEERIHQFTGNAGYPSFLPEKREGESNTTPHRYILPDCLEHITPVT
ncbi:MAG: M3 family metallopeptidase [Methanospirillum sp.]|nr:M3 family metallopeptidase [Methanospirillum sp.]